MELAKANIEKPEGLAVLVAGGDWARVVGSQRGPKPLCDLCGRARGGRPGDGEAADDGIFRSVLVDGGTVPITVCGRCLRERTPPPRRSGGNGGHDAARRATL